MYIDEVRTNPTAFLKDSTINVRTYIDYVYKSSAVRYVRAMLGPRRISPNVGTTAAEERQRDLRASYHFALLSREDFPPAAT